ncbi:MAG: dockerin type I repeat-containing protein [Candidatus Zixiibacteriota bacterium]
MRLTIRLFLFLTIFCAYVNGANLVEFRLYDATHGVELASGDTIYTADVNLVPVHYELRIYIENDVPLGSMSLGILSDSPDDLSINWLPQPDGWGTGGQNAGFAAVTVNPDCRFDPDLYGSFDLTGLLINENDVNSIPPDSILMGGAALFNSLPAGDLDLFFSIHFSLEGDNLGTVASLLFDSTTIPPAGDWIFANTDGITFTPGFSGQINFPVQVLCVDHDGDGVCGPLDNCPDTWNPDQIDIDNNGVGDMCQFACGDVNQDDGVNIGDVLYIIDYLFKSGPPPPIVKHADVDCSDVVNISDAVYLMNFIFNSGPVPCASCPL